MKIPLQIVAGKIWVSAIINSVKYRIYGRIDFCVDTGSDETFISQSDVLRFKISFEALPFVENTKIGGSNFEIKRIKEINLYFKTEEQKLEKITMPKFAVLRGTKKTDEAIQEANSIPSLIGTDFLLANNLALYFNPSLSIAYLEKE